MRDPKEPVIFRGAIAVMFDATLGAADFVGAKLARPIQGDQYMAVQIPVGFQQPLPMDGLVQKVERGVYSDWIDRVTDFA
jgi:hypothetical protein